MNTGGPTAETPTIPKERIHKMVIYFSLYTRSYIGAVGNRCLQSSP